MRTEVEGSNNLDQLSQLAPPTGDGGEAFYSSDELEAVRRQIDDSRIVERQAREDLSDNEFIIERLRHRHTEGINQRFAEMIGFESLRMAIQVEPVSYRPLRMPRAALLDSGNPSFN